MKKILAFAGSNNSASINHKLIEYAASQIEGHAVEVISLTHYVLPIFSVDLERESGFPESLHKLKDTIQEADALIISVNEHNGSISAFFKNTLDWLSRIEYKFLEDKKVLLMSSSTGSRGGLSAFEYMESIIPRYGAEIVARYRLPSFADNFSDETRSIIHKELLFGFTEALNKFTTELS